MPRRPSKRDPPTAASTKAGTGDDRAPRRSERGSNPSHVCCRVFLVSIGTHYSLITRSFTYLRLLDNAFNRYNGYHIFYSSCWNLWSMEY